MANNPNPTRISAAMWEFIEALEALEPADTEYAGSWGDFKPGYHCDRNTLLTHTVNGVKVWANDYSIRLPADKLGPGAMGAANDWTFRSAQAGNMTNIRKYGARVRAAFLARDPRLHGWREVLCQGDADDLADGYDFVSWTERTPDDTHRWHFHFSKLRQYVEDRASYQAMLSILRGETLAQSRAGGSTDMATVFRWDNKYWISRGDAKEREVVSTQIGVATGEMNVVCSAHRVFPDAVTLGQVGYPSTDLKTQRGWSEALVDLTFGKVAATQPVEVSVDLSEEDIAALAAQVVGAVPSAASIAEAVLDEDHHRSEA